MIIVSDVNFNQKRGWVTRWSEEEDNILKENYSSHSIDQLLNLLPNRNKKGIYSRAHKLGLKYHSYNKNYFAVIDTPEKAYWVGFLTADGYITTQSRWGVEINVEDIEHLEKLNKSLDSNITIRTREKKSYGKVSTTCSLNFKSKTMYDDLVRLGFTHDKSYNAEFSTLIPHELRLDYIKGIIDGDGSYITTENTKRICLYSNSMSMLEAIQDTLLSHSINSTISHRESDGTNVLMITRKKDMKVFLETILQSNSPMLSRKESKARKLLSEIGGGH